MSGIDPALAAEYGVEERWSLALTRRAEWRDTDGFGHVNHLAYLEWCEDIRNRYMEAVGLPRLSAETPGPVLKSVSFDYARALGFGDEVLVTARVAAMRRTSFTMDYAVWQAGLIGRGSALCVLMINRTGERVPIPEAMRAAIAARDGIAPMEPGG
jgi:acyl-CoA thioester hydrolase